MELDIVIRAADPARAAELLGHLGIRLAEPNRPNPGIWHAWLSASITVGACGAGEEPGLALAIPGFAAALAAAVPGAVAVSRDGKSLLDVGGAKIPFRSDGGAIARPAADEALLPYAEAILQHVRHELAAILARHAMVSVRLAGPQMLNGDLDRRFALIVRGVDDHAIAELQALFDSKAHPTFRIDIIDATGIDPETNDRIERLAWDLHL